MKLLTTIFFAATIFATASHAENRVVTFTNNTAVAVHTIFGSNTGADTWEEDILGEGVLEANDAIDINFDDGTGYCMFDFKVTFADGDEGTLSGVNVCEISDVTID